MVLANPTSRFLPQQTWLELIRWCLVGTPNGGSQQWARPEVTTVVSYSDPSAGHTGVVRWIKAERALYKACNWMWAPTWHRLRPPPSGNGKWPGRGAQSVKDRWVFPIRPDAGREMVLRIEDAGLRRLHAASEYRDPKRLRRAA